MGAALEGQAIGLRFFHEHAEHPAGQEGPVTGKEAQGFYIRLIPEVIIGEHVHDTVYAVGPAGPSR